MPSSSSPAPRPRRRLALRLAAATAGAAALTTVLAAVVYTLVLLPELPRLRSAPRPDLGLATIAYTADGEELARYYRENRTWLPIGRIGAPAVQALVATEDHRFYRHGGVDVRRLASSVLHSLRGDPQGGSTITMQLARNLFPTVRDAPTAERKVKELITAVKLERNYSKDDILEMYLNTVPFGYQAFGIEAAAQTYFGKAAAALDVREAATLVGMLKGTSRYNPVRHPDLARARRDVVLGQLAKRGVLSPTARDSLRAEPLGLRFAPPTPATGPAPYFAEHVRLWLEEWADANGYDLYADGLRVYTTLDSRLQALAGAAVAEQTGRLQAVADVEWSRAHGWALGDETAPYERAAPEADAFAHFWRTHPRVADDHLRRSSRYRALAARVGEAAAAERLRADAAFTDSLRAAATRLEAGFVAVDPRSGAVRAWVGGRDFTRDRYDHVALARRQPGSTFKPFVYAAAVDLGYSPLHTVLDAPATYETASGETWTPRNAGGGASGEALTLADALALSKNTVTARLMAEIGPNGVAKMAERLGIRSPLDRVPSLGLGTSEVTLLELAAAYSTLAAGGLYHEPVVVTRIEDRDGNVLARFLDEGEKVVSSHTAYTVVDMLRGVVDRGTATRLRWQWGVEADVAGKTGTTQHGADGWFMLMHPHLVAGAWVGFNDRRVTFRSDFWGQGAHNALFLVGDFMRRLAEGGALPTLAARFEPPPGYHVPSPDDVRPGEAPRTPTLRAGLDPLGAPVPRDAQREGLRPSAPPPAAAPGDPAARDADLEAALRRGVAAGIRDALGGDGARPDTTAAPPDPGADPEGVLRDALPPAGGPPSKPRENGGR